jgi:hypothetical protein
MATEPLVTDRIEAEVRTVMAMRAGLRCIPGTHAKQAELLVELDVLLDQWLELSGGTP